MATVHYETVADEIEDLKARFDAVTEIKKVLDEKLAPMIERAKTDSTRQHPFNVSILFNAKINSRTVSFCINENASRFKVGEDSYFNRSIEFDFHFTKSLKYFNITDIGMRTPNNAYWAKFFEPISAVIPVRYFKKIKFKNFEDLLPIILALFEPDLSEDGYNESQARCTRDFKKLFIKKEANLKGKIGKDSATI